MSDMLDPEVRRAVIGKTLGGAKPQAPEASPSSPNPVVEGSAPVGQYKTPEEMLLNRLNYKGPQSEADAKRDFVIKESRKAAINKIGDLLDTLL